MRELTVDRRMAVVRMMEEGILQKDVARALGIGQGTVCKIWAKYLEHGHVANLQGRGRSRMTTPREDRLLHRLCHVNPHLPQSAVRDQFRQATGRHLSVQTVRRRQHEAGRRAYRPAVVPRLRPNHRVARLAWCQARVQWENRDWSQILFSDESRFAIHQGDGRARVWRPQGTRFQAQFLLPKHRHTASVMVWAGIGTDLKTRLVFVDQTMTARRYIDQVLRPVVVPLREGRPELLLADDNARPHRARIVDQFCQEQLIQHLPWPACSPDLNPIENAWDELQRRVYQRPEPPRTLPQLRIALEEEWENLPQEYLARLVDSMQRRCRAVIAARGGQTKY